MRTRLLAATVLMLLVGPITTAHAYEKVRAGTWKLRSGFDEISGGSMKVSKDATKISGLKVTPGEENVEACGAGSVKARRTLTVKKYRSANGRPAVATKGPNGLFVPTRTTFVVGGKNVSGKIMLLFERDGKTLGTGQIRFGDCFLQFSGNRFV